MRCRASQGQEHLLDVLRVTGVIHQRRRSGGKSKDALAADPRQSPLLSEGTVSIPRGALSIGQAQGSRDTSHLSYVG
jgi:hypothetical protein